MLVTSYAHSGVPRRGALLTLLVGLLGSLAAPTTVAGQTAFWQLDLNGSRIRYDTLDALNAPSLAGSVEWQRSKLLARVGASLTGFENNGRSVQGRGDLVGWLSPVGERSPLRLEVSGSVGGSSHSGGFDSSVGQGDVRLHAQGRVAGAWLGVGAAMAKNTFDDDAVQGVLPNLGGWVQLGPARLIGRYVDTRIEGERFPEMTVSAVLSGSSLDLTAFAGLRDSPFQNVDSDAWIGGSVALWVRSGLALLLSGGRYAPDILQGLPGGDFFSVGIRLQPRRRRPIVSNAPLPLMFSRDATRSGAAGFVVNGARTVEIAGDWNGWRPAPLSRGSDGRWLLPTGVPAGVHRFNLLVDGEKWIVPEGVPSVDDGFGGQVGLLVIYGS